MGEVVRFPLQADGYPGAQHWGWGRLGEVPDKVVRIREPYRAPARVPLSPAEFMMVAVIDAMSDRRPGRSFAAKVLDVLAAKLRCHREDIEVRMSLCRAIDLLCSDSAGRW